MALFKIKSEIPFPSAEAVDSTLLDNELQNWSVLEDVILRRAWLVGIFPDEFEAAVAWKAVMPLLADAGVVVVGEPERQAMGDADWRESYKAHFHAWKFGRLHWVPVWERETFKLPMGDAVLWLDPGMAFGTGNHETTRLCVERIVEVTESEKRDRSALRVIDAGCGSGILALSAALLGYGSVVGFDNDPEAVRVSEENAELNGVAGNVRFYVGDLASGFGEGPGDIVFANILANVLIQYARELTAAVAKGGTLILSGILAIEVEQVKAAFAAVAPDWRQESRVLGAWSDVVLVRHE